MRPTPVKVAMTIRFKVMPPATAARTTNLPAEMLHIKFFFFGSCGTAFHSCNVFCGSRHIVPFERVVSMWLK